MTDTRQALAALLPCPFCGNSKGLAVANENPQDLSGGYFIACPSCDASTGLRFACGEDPIPLLIEQWNRRAALSAQSVAGAVATDETGWLIEHSGEILPGVEQRAQVGWLRVQMKFNGYGAREFGLTHDANEALRFSRREDAEAVLAMHLGARPPDWYSNPFSVTEHMRPDALQPQAAPAPEPSAQGEPVAWRPGDPIYDDAYVRGVAVGFAEDDSRRTTLLRIADRIEARASAPSTSPPAVVEAVPIPDCTVADVGFRWDMEAQRHVPQVLVEFEPTPPNSPVDAKGWKDRNAFAAFVKSRGIAPKAAQP